MEEKYYFISRIIIKLLQPKQCGIAIKIEKQTNETEKIPEIFSYEWTSNFKRKVNRKFCGETTVFPKYGAGTIRYSNVISTLQSIHISHYMQIYLDYNTTCKKQNC